MFGTLAGALSGRKIPFDRQLYNATVDGRIVRVGRTIKIESIAVHYELTAAPGHQDEIERALRVHPEGCPAHQSVKDAIAVMWDARVHIGEDVLELRGEDSRS